MGNFKAYSTALVMVLAAASGAQAQTGGMKGMDMKGAPAHDMSSHDMSSHDMKGMKGMETAKPSPAHNASGTVQRIDPAKGTVSIAHGPVKSLNWPAMTMSFAVKDKAMLDNLKPGAKVAFGFVQSGADYVVTEIKGQ